MKAWTPDHLQLAQAAERVRRRLREEAQRVGGDLGGQLSSMAYELTIALKGRASRGMARCSFTGGHEREL